MIRLVGLLVSCLYGPTARPARRSPRAAPLTLTSLEDRLSPDVNAAEAPGSWSDPNIWSQHATPTATQEVEVNLGSGTVTHSAGTHTVGSLTSNGSLNITGGKVIVAGGAIDGTLSVTSFGALTLAGATTTGNLNVTLTTLAPVYVEGTVVNTGHTISLNGPGSLVVLGKLTGGTVALSGGASLLSWNGALDGVTVSGGSVSVVGPSADTPFSLTVTNGLTLNGTDVAVGSATADGHLIFRGNGAQALGGTGTITFGGPKVARNGILLDAPSSPTAPSSPETLTFGSGITIHGGGGYIGFLGPVGTTSVVYYPAPTDVPFLNRVVNYGTITADQSGGFIVVDAALTNNGTIRAAGGTLVLSGRLTWGATASSLDVAVGSRAYLDAGSEPGAPVTQLTVTGGGQVYALGDGDRLAITAQGGTTLTHQNDLTAAQYADAIAIVGDWMAQLPFTQTGPQYDASTGAIPARQQSDRSPDFYSTSGSPLVKVTAYFGNLAVIGLLRGRGSAATGVAAAWLRWNAAHLNADGTIYDYSFTRDGRVEDIQLAPPADILVDTNRTLSDADDSNASTFLLAAWAYYEHGGDPAVLTEIRPKLVDAANLLVSLSDPNTGLTRALLTPRPNVPGTAHYLEDNAESYAGLRAMARLMTAVFRDPAGAAMYDTAANHVLRGINTALYNAGTYRAAVEQTLPGWYPNYQALAWPVLHAVPAPAADPGAPAAQFGIIDGQWDNSATNQPDWTDNLADHTAGGFYSTAVGYAAFLAGDFRSGRVATEWVLGQAFPTWALRTTSSVYATQTPAAAFTAADGGYLLDSLVLMTTAAPTATVAPLPALSPNTFTVSWSGVAGPAGAALASYSVYSTNDFGATYLPLVTNTTATSATFTGQAGRTYGFYVVAKDAAGNVGAAPTVAQEYTTVPMLTVVGGGGQSAAATTAFGALLDVQVTDGQSHPVDTWPVTFTAPSSGATAALSPAAGPTNPSGHLFVAATAGMTAGTYTVTATAAGLTPTVTFTLTNTHGPAATISVTGSNQSATVNTAFTTALTARVTDAFGNAVDGVTVTFGAPPSTGASAVLTPAAPTTDMNGQVMVSATANQRAGVYGVTAAVAGVPTPGSFQLTNRPGAAAAVAAAAGTPQSAAVGMPFAPLTARVTDAYGNPVPNVAVTFAAPGNQATFPAGGTATTDPSGLATVTPTAGPTVGHYTVTAAAAGVAAPAGFDLTNLSGPPAAVTVFAGDGQSARVGTALAADLVVRVTDANGNPLDGVAVTFAGPGVTFTPSTVATASGLARGSATGLTVAGDFTVTAAVAGVVAPAVFVVHLTPGPADHLAVSGFPAATTAGVAHAVTVTAYDALGNVATGYAGTVRFASSDARAVLPADAGFTTADHGVKTVAGVELRTAGTGATVSATDTAVGTVTGTVGGIAVAAGPAAHVTAAAGAGQTAAVDQPFPSQLRVAVTDAFGNPVNGAAVTFSGAGVVFTSTPTPTTANGAAEVTATAGMTAGSFSIQAAVAGAGAPATFALTVTPGPAAVVAAESGGGQSLAVDTPFVIPLVARVLDAHGNAVANAAVVFSGPGLAAPVTATTDSTGRATAYPTTGPTAGATPATAGVAGVSATFDLTVTAGPAAHVMPTGGDGQTTTVGSAFPAPLKVRVTDAHGNPVPTAAVTLSGPELVLGSAPVTDADGRTAVAATAGPTPGTYLVTAAAGGAPPATFTLTVEAIPVIAVAPTVGGELVASGSPLVAVVSDQYGRRVAGVVVTFAGDGVAFPAGAVAVSGADGTARVVAVTARLTGTAPVTATAAGAVAAFAVAAPRTRFAVGAGAGGPALVTVYNPDGSVADTLDPFPGTTGGVRTAVGDFNADGTPDIVVGTGPGPTAEVKVLDGATGGVLFDIRPFADFTGGVFVAAGDITGDGTPELVVTPDLSGGPRVSVFRGVDFTKIDDFYGIDDPNFRGGARAALGDIDGDGAADLVISAGFGGGPRISVYDGRALAGGGVAHLVPDFFLFEDGLRNGCYVAVGDVDGDGMADLVGGGGPGGGPRVLVVSGRPLRAAGPAAAIAAQVANFFAGNPDNRGGVRVAVKNQDGDAHADLVIGDGEGSGSRVIGYGGADVAGGAAPQAFGFDAFPGSLDGVFVG